MRILVVWEDQYFKQLDVFVKRRLPALRPASLPPFPKVMHHTCRGNGRFEHYVRETWTNNRSAGLPGDAGFIDHLIAVVDGDKLHGLLPSVGKPPTTARDVPAWHQQAMTFWQKHVHAAVDPSVPSTTVHGHVLRWSKESLALAGHDRSAAEEHLGLKRDDDALQRFLAACAPDPRTVSDTDFSDTYLKPLVCLENARKAVGVTGTLKNSPEIDDALKDLAQTDVDLVCRRVPDIDQIVDLIWRLANPTGPSASPHTATQAVPTQTGKSKGVTAAKPGKAASPGAKKVRR